MVAPAMTDIAQALREGSTSLWLFIPSAIILGGLHGLEPGHSKTMMAAFIIAIRGTIAQAVLLGVCAAISHSLVIWVLASLALHFGSQWNAEHVEPYLQLGSAVVILALALWMFLRTRRELHAAHHHHCDHHCHHGHHGHTEGHSDEHHGGYQDAHELEHAEEIRRRFAGRAVTTGQIALFGITGGLMPCPAAFGVLLICLQLKQISLGATLVASFSLGLALTMVTTGALAAWSVHHAQRKFSGFGEVMRRAPYVSSALLVLIAIYMAFHAWRTLGVL